MKTFLLSLLLLLAVGCSRSDEEMVPTGPSLSMSRNVHNRYIVVFKSSVTDVDATIDEVVRGHGANVSHRYKHTIKGFAAGLPEQAITAIANNPNVDYVESDGIATVNGSQPNPPSWGLDRVNQRALPLDQLYNYDTDGTGVTVYIIDTGIFFNHSEYVGRAFSGYDFIDNDADAADCHGHGTHVAGTVGGTTVGIAKNVKLVAVRVLNCGGSGAWSQVIAGIDWVTANKIGPTVANMSLGGGFTQAVTDAVEASSAAGVVHVVAAGNGNDNACLTSPAAAPSAITVGAVSSNDVRATFSNYGACVDIFAPGVDIRSSTQDGSYANWAGTSMASPHVAGAAALILTTDPTFSPVQVDSAIFTGATKGIVQNANSVKFHLLYTGLDDDLSTPVPPPPPPPPAAPSNLTAVWVTIDSTSYTDKWWGLVRMNWIDNSTNEEQFELRGTNIPLNYGMYGYSIANYPQAHVTITEGPWTLEVRATNLGGNSEWISFDICVPGKLGLCTPLNWPPVPPPPPPPATKIHSGDLDGAKIVRKQNWTATVTIKVENESDQAVAGAVVSGRWNTGNTISCTTDGTGRCSLKSNNLRAAFVQFTVTGIQGPNLEYNSSANHDPDGDSNGTSITISK